SLTGTLHDTLSQCRWPYEQDSRMLVAEVLGPEEREDRELEAVRVASEQVSDAVELPVGQPQRTVKRRFRRDLRQGPECSGEGRRAPSAFGEGLSRRHSLMLLALAAF